MSYTKCEIDGCDRIAIKTNSRSQHVCAIHAVGGLPQFLARKKFGRNDICPCGSGKKFKRCHGAPPKPPEPSLESPVPAPD